MDDNKVANTSDCLALTIRKEHRLVVVKKTVTKAIMVSWKAILAAIALSVVNLFV